MSTARQVVDPFFLSPATATASPERAAVVRPSLLPRIPLQWWWGNASSALVSGASKGAGAPASTPAAAGSPSACSGCGA